MKSMQILFSVLLFSCVNSVYAIQVPAPLVDTEWLAKHRDEVRILDVRSEGKSFTAQPKITMDKKSGKKRVRKVGGHIPGAVLVNNKNVRATRVIDGREVQKMLPDKDAFAGLMRKSGVNSDSAVVIVSKGRNSGDVTSAARLYWQLKYYGHDNVAILDGGFAQWLIDDRKISLAASKPAGEGDWKAAAKRREILATSDDVAAALEGKSTQLVDTRSLGQYLGTWKKSYVYAKGHIPGAKIFPNELMTRTGAPAKFNSLEELREAFAALGIDPAAETVTYCNSGNLASVGWFIQHELMGNGKARLYDGSMHQWTLEKRPVTALQME